MSKINSKLKILLSISLILLLTACQKKQLDLAEAKPADDLPEYTVQADGNTPAGIEKPVVPDDQKPE